MQITKRARRSALATAALVGSFGGLVLGGGGVAQASNTQITAVGSFTTFDMMNALFPATVNNVNPNALTGTQTETIDSDPISCVGGVTYSTAKQPPNGSGQGKTALAAEETAAANEQGCIDFSRSSSPPAPNAETLPSGSHESGDPVGSHFQYYAYALDGVVPLVGSNAGGTAVAPVTLTLQEVKNIYSCWNPATSTPVTTWAQAGVGTNTGTIVRYWPQSGSGTRAVYTDVLGFDPTVLDGTVNHCATGPIVSFTSGSQTAPNEENSEDGIIYNQVANSVSDANAIYVYSAGKFESAWNGPTDNSSTANNIIDQQLTGNTNTMGNFDTSLTLANMESTTNHSDPYVDFTPPARGSSGRGTEAIDNNTISEANEWYSHLPASSQTNGDPSDSTASVPGVRFVYNVDDTLLPDYNGARFLVGFDNQAKGSTSALCNGSDSATIIAQGFVPLTTTGGGAHDNLDGSTCREFPGLAYPTP